MDYRCRRCSCSFNRYCIFLTKGKALRQKRLLSEIPADLQARFANIKDLKGKEFVDKAYKEMTDYMGLSKVAPKGITVNSEDKAYEHLKAYSNYEGIGFWAVAVMHIKISLLKLRLMLLATK